MQNELQISSVHSIIMRMFLMALEFMLEGVQLEVKLKLHKWAEWVLGFWGEMSDVKREPGSRF